jgi:hypothetical protein
LLSLTIQKFAVAYDPKACDPQAFKALTHPDLIAQGWDWTEHDGDYYSAQPHQFTAAECRDYLTYPGPNSDKPYSDWTQHFVPGSGKTTQNNGSIAVVEYKWLTKMDGEDEGVHNGQVILKVHEGKWKWFNATHDESLPSFDWW